MLHQSTHSSPHGTTHDLQKQHTNFRDAEPAVWPHPLTFEPFGVDLFDEVGVDVSCYELGLGDDVPQHWDVVVDTCGRRRRGREGRHLQCQQSVEHCPTHTADTSYL